ncbi:hypothetical protein N8508_00200 [bacterium]|nr:hypothetical protein [bacterium]
MDIKRDCSHWAKKFDKVKHIPRLRIGGSVECGKYGALLGNNYSTNVMPICPDCIKAKKGGK